MIDADVGRPISDIKPNIDFEHIGTRRFNVSARRIRASQAEGPVGLMQIEGANDGNPSQGTQDRATAANE